MKFFKGILFLWVFFFVSYSQVIFCNFTDASLNALVSVFSEEFPNLNREDIKEVILEKSYEFDIDNINFEMVCNWETSCDVVVNAEETSLLHEFLRAIKKELEFM